MGWAPSHREGLAGGVGGEGNVIPRRVPGGIGTLPVRAYLGKVHDAGAPVLGEDGSAAPAPGMEYHAGRIPRREMMTVEAASAGCVVGDHGLLAPARQLAAVEAYIFPALVVGLNKAVGYVGVDRVGRHIYGKRLVAAPPAGSLCPCRNGNKNGVAYAPAAFLELSPVLHLEAQRGHPLRHGDAHIVGADRRIFLLVFEGGRGACGQSECRKDEQQTIHQA